MKSSSLWCIFIAFNPQQMSLVLSSVYPLLLSILSGDGSLSDRFP